MVRTVYCRWEGCGESDESTVGQEKEFCPACKREARWSVLPGRTIKERRKKDAPFDLSFNDRRMLKQFGIAVNNDYESDGA